MYKGFKRPLDLLLALITSLLLAPLLLWVAWRIKQEDGGPVLFKHMRVGKGGALFPCFKFRTMRTDAQATLDRWKATNSPEWQEFQVAHKLTNDPRVLGVGRLLRKASLDELPQLLNVFRGEMSLVGPRPVTAEELVHYEAYQGLAEYLACTPGVSGLWQVSGRSDTSYEERVALDKRYAYSISFSQDLLIMIKTLTVPFSQRGAY